MDAYDRELYHHNRLPTVTYADGPTALYMAWLAEQEAKVVPIRTGDNPLEASGDDAAPSKQEAAG